IIVPSEYLKKIVTNWGVNSERIVVIYNAFQPQEIILNKKEVRAELGLGSGESQILISAGRLVPWKGFDLLIKIMPEIRMEFPRAKLFIAGSGPEKDNLEKVIRENNLSEFVKYLGQLNKEILSKYLKAADLFVLNTAYEGFSHQLLEVMSLGTIALVTDTGGNPELIQSKDQLFKYNNKESLVEAIKNLLKMTLEQKLQRQMSQKYVETTFTKDKMLENLILTLELKNK
ncbi:MAG: glycosyltransferase family 4 protein, partial [Candidatus Paceibacterota bacterium]